MKFEMDIPQGEMLKLDRDLQRYLKRKDDGIWLEMVDYADSVYSLAKLTAPISRYQKKGHGGALKASVKTFQKKSDFSVIVQAGGTEDSSYAPYVNYGTGERVFRGYRFRDDDKNYARRFKKTKRIKGQYANAFLSFAVDKYYPRFIRNVKKLLGKK